MAYQQAQQGMAGQMANAQRNASSGAQALAAGAGAQAQLQSIAPQLAAQQAAYSQQQQANLNQARGLMTEEQRTKFSDMLSANQARQNFGLGLAQSGSAMKSQGLGAIAQGGLSLATAGINAQSAGKTLPQGVEMSSIPSIGDLSGVSTTPTIPTAMYKSTIPTIPTSSITNSIPSIAGQTSNLLPVDNTENLRFSLKKAFGQQPFSNTNPFPTPIYPNYGSYGPNLF
jgi:multidrug efflux pump subunit AcrA (membrane-fusion protein)